MIPTRAVLALSASLAFVLAASPSTASPSRSVAPAQAPSAAVRAAAKPLVLPFLEDEYTKAVAQARARKLPIFVEAWAPW